MNSGLPLRRYALLAAFLLVLLVPLFRHGEGAAPGAAVPAAATAGPVEHLVIVTPHLEAVRRKFSLAFSAWYAANYHTAVEVDFLNYGGGSEIVKFFQTSRPTFEKLGTYEVDLVWGGSDYLFNESLEKKGYLQKANLDPAVVAAAFPQTEIGGLPLYDSDKKNGPQWYGTALSSFGIMYNRDLLRDLRLPEPRTWADLADPRYRNWVILADPTRSSSAKTMLMTIVEREMATAQQQGLPEGEGWTRGMGLIRQIAANAKGFEGASNLPPSMVSSGEAAAAMSIDFYARTQIAAVEPGRVGYVEPRGATVITPEPIGIVAGAQHVELARRFIEFLLSEPAQRLWITKADPRRESPEMALRRLPIRRAVYDHPDNFSEYTNPYLAAGNFNTKTERTSGFGLLDELIALSCIDLLPELRETRAAILASPHAQELDARLGRFPIDEAASRDGVAAYRKMLSGDPREWLALQQKWLNGFRTEYRTLRELCGGAMSYTRRLTPYLVFAAIAAFFGVFLIWPVVRVVVVGLGLPGSGARLQFTPSYLMAVFSSYEFRHSLFNSAAIAAVVTLLCTLISVPLALLSRRFEFRGKSVATSLLLVPLVLPPFVGAIGLRQIFGASGALTAVCRAVGLIRPDQVVSWLTGHEFTAVVIAEAFSLYPILFLNVAAALSNLDPAMEQAAANLGASSWRIFRSVTLASLRPGLFAGGAIVFIWSFGELGTPLMFDFYSVAPVQIFFHITEISDNPIPYALVIVMLLVSAAVYIAGKVAVGRADLAQTRVAFAAAGERATGWRAAWILLPFGVVVGVALLPHIGVVLTSFSATGYWYNSVLPKIFTTDQYVHALSHQIVLSSIRNSVLFSLSSVVLDIVIGTAIAILIVRSRLPGILRILVDTLSMLPLAVPGMVLAFGYLAISLQFKVWFLGHDGLLQYVDVQRNPTLLLVLAYTMRRLPYVVRSTVAGLEQTPQDLELAARNIGASVTTTLRRITVPLITPNLIAAALLVFAFTMLEVSDSLILVQKPAFWPVTRGIYELWQRLGDGPYIASALGAWTMLLMMLVILFVNSLLGKRLGALFRI